MKINQKQIESVLALNSAKRYEHFVKVVADWQEVWGLYNDGWAMAATDENVPVFPMWPAREYALLCSNNEWANYTPESFSLDALINELLPKLEKDGVIPGVFYTPSDKGVLPFGDQLIADLNNELEKY